MSDCTLLPQPWLRDRAFLPRGIGHSALVLKRPFFFTRRPLDSPENIYLCLVRVYVKRPLELQALPGPFCQELIAGELLAGRRSYHKSIRNVGACR
jgi:hypothetical protein